MSPTATRDAQQEGHRRRLPLVITSVSDGNVELRLEAIDYLTALQDAAVARRLLRKARTGGPDAVRRYAELALVARGEERGSVARWPGPFATLQQGFRGDDPRAGAVRYVGAPGMSGLAHALTGEHAVESGAHVARVLGHEGGFVLELRGQEASAASREGPFDEVVVAVPPRAGEPRDACADHRDQPRAHADRSPVLRRGRRRLPCCS